MDKTLTPIASIKVSRFRIREDIGDVDALAQSLMTFGQLQPIIIDDDMELIAGFRRFTAAQLNGWQDIWAEVQGRVPELLARELELEENIQRKQMSWLEEQRAIVEIEDIRRRDNPNWGQAQTAQMLGVNQYDISNARTIVKMAEQFPDIAKAKNKSQALSWSKTKVANVVRVLDVKQNTVDFGSIEDRIHLGDAVDYVASLPSGCVDAVITDPPFGIDYDEYVAGTTGSLTEYQDDEESYERLLTMAPDLYRVLKENGWLVWFLGFRWYEQCKQTFSEAGFYVDELPIIWDRSAGRTFTNRPDRYFARAYDIALHCRKGNAKIVQQGKPNIISIRPVDGREKEALVERPVDLYAELIRRLTISGETVLDPFVGSGSCPAAAASLGRSYLGSEISPERRAIAIKKIFSFTPSI